MIVRGIQFSSTMARANVTGAKTQTRRAFTNRSARRLLDAFRQSDSEGVLLYQREAFRLEASRDAVPPRVIAALNFTEMPVWFEADSGAPAANTQSKWEQPFGRLRAAMHMPKWASRAALRVVNIRQQRLGDITNDDALAEGITAHTDRGETRYGIQGRYGAPSATADGWDWKDWEPSPRAAYLRLYARVNGMRVEEIDADAVVIAFSYRVVRKNILELERLAA